MPTATNYCCTNIRLNKLSLCVKRADRFRVKPSTSNASDISKPQVNAKKKYWLSRLFEKTTGVIHESHSPKASH
jgi:hypothetical protein